MNGSALSEYISKASKSKKINDLIDLLHSLISKQFNILESNVFISSESSNLELIVETGTSNTLQKNISKFEEEGIIDFVITQGTCFIVPNLTDSSTTAKSYIFCPSIVNNIYYIFAAISNNELTFFTDEHKHEIEKLFEVASSFINLHLVNNENQNLKKKIIELNEKMSNIEKFGILGDITNSIVKEFQIPMQIINANVELIKSGIGDTNRRMQIINEQFGILNDIYKRLNSFVFTDSEFNNFENIDLVEFVKGIIAISSNKLQRDGIKIVFESELIKACFVGMRNQMEQVFISLLDNAKATMPEGGIIKIGIYENHKNKVTVNISDTGVGFSEEELKEILSISYVKSRKDFIGLYYIQNIIKEHKGKIIVSSEIAKGTSYKIMLPTVQNSR